MNNSNKIAQIFKVLSVDTRVRIVQLLKDRSLCVNALAKLLDITPAAVSQHLRVLRNTEIVKAEKRGYFVHYFLNKETLKQWKDLADTLLEIDTT
jgi:DNA-binding transcriptional ArsR family regulator